MQVKEVWTSVEELEAFLAIRRLSKNELIIAM